MTTPITLFRCANCGSSRVTPYIGEKKMKHFILNSFRNQSADSYRCPDCGAVLDHCMSQPDKKTADSITVLGTKNKRTEEFLHKYPKIELDPVVRALYQNR